MPHRRFPSPSPSVRTAGRREARRVAPFGRMATGWEIAYAALFFYLRRERLRQRPSAGGRQRNYRALRAKNRGEDFIRRQVGRGNKSTAEQPVDEAHIAIFQGISTT